MKLILATILAMFISVPAMAACISETQAYLSITNKYKEVVIETNVRNFPNVDGVRVDLFFNDATGSWTLIGTLNGISCLIKSGHSKERISIADILDGPAT